MGVTVIDPRKGSLLDLIEKCQISRVMTIDTALAHLCAASGIEADLLLCLFPDERWQELHKPEHNYGQFLKLWRSSFRRLVRRTCLTDRLSYFPKKTDQAMRLFTQKTMKISSPMLNL